jgi:gas vesicle protein
LIYKFVYNIRLGIKLPSLNKEWSSYTKNTQEKILNDWEKIRGMIPDRIKDIEQNINDKQENLNEEENFEKSCILNEEIADLASVINDLWLWYRSDQHITEQRQHQ